MRATKLSVGRAVSVALALAWAAPASAQTAVFVDLSGRGAGTVRGRVVDTINDADGLRVTDDASAADATVHGEIARSRRRWSARMRVTGRGGAELTEGRLTARQPAGLARRIRRWTERDAVPALQQLAPPEAEPTREPPATQARRSEEPESRPAAEPEPERERGERGPPPPIRFELGAVLTHRRLSYRDDIFAELRPYELPLWPYIHFGVEYFIGHHTPELDGLFGLSFYAATQFAVGLSSRSDNGGSFPTTTWGLDVGARYRVFVDEVTLLADLAYRTFTFSLGDAESGAARPAIPGVEYHALRAGLGVRWDIGFGFFFTGAGGFAFPFASGEILGEDWFARGDAGAVDMELGFGQRVDDFEFRARFAYRRFYFSFNPEPGDARVAGGALDEYFQGVFDIAYTPSGL